MKKPRFQFHVEQMATTLQMITTCDIIAAIKKNKPKEG